MKRIIILLIGLFIILSSCILNMKPHTWTDFSLDNQSSIDVLFYTRRLETINYNEDGTINSTDPAEETYMNHGLIKSGTIEIFERPSGAPYSMYCEAVENTLRWEKEDVYIEYDEDYTWTIFDPPTGDIIINNNSNYMITIVINGSTENPIGPGLSNVYTKFVGNYNLIAISNQKSWQKNIDLTETGYTWNLNLNTELYPSENCRVWNFENNYEDHLRVDDWTIKTNVAISSAEKKFGSYSFFATAEKIGFLGTNAAWGTIGESQSSGVWFYYDGGTGFSVIEVGGMTNGFIIIASENKLRIEIYKSRTLTTVTSTDDIELNTWNYAAFSYEKNTNTVYLVLNNKIYTGTPVGAWGVGTYVFITFSENTANKQYIDELIIASDQFISPEVWSQHYNHNVPWGGEYIP